MQSGDETFRTEDTMLRMAFSQGYTEAKSYVTTTGIMFSAGYDYPTKIEQIEKRALDLEKIARINAVSRKLTAHQMTLEEAYETLKYIEQANFFLNRVWQIFFAAIASGCYVILFQGTFVDMPAATVAGGLGYLALLFFNRTIQVKIFAEFFAALVVGLVAVLAVKTGLGLELNKIIISAVMPLVPGVAITNAVRDLTAGHFVSGISKGVEGCLTALAIGSGIAVILSF
jgi:uncharacterized membrane protein YjjP (DUF1212 family)